MSADRDLASSEEDRRLEDANAKPAWEKPAIVAYEPASSAAGISYTPLDGISNLTV